MSTESAYSYTKTQWQNGVTPINEGNLNKIEDGIATALSRGGGGLDIGAIIPFSGDINSIPDGFMLCDGSAISRTTYATLFSIIGTTYGNGDGSTTFNLPDLRGRTIVGLDSNDTDFDTLGETGGSKDLQAHSHDVLYQNFRLNTNRDANSGSTGATRALGFSTSSTSGSSETKAASTGAGDSGNLQPYITINYIIKVAESSTVPETASIVSTYSESSVNGYSCNYVNGTNGKILWTNANPESDFSSQEITLSSSDYDVYEIVYISEKSGGFSSIYNMTKSIKGYGTVLQTVNPIGSTTPNRARVVNYVSDTKLSFSVGYTGAGYPLGTDNSKCIPLYVIGYKTGLFD